MQPVVPPAPLTGDVGRGCGDASRALLFDWNLDEIPQPPTFGSFGTDPGSSVPVPFSAAVPSAPTRFIGFPKLAKV